MSVGNVPELIFTSAFALTIALAVCTQARPIAARLLIFDLPDQERKQHRRPTPLVGGVALAAALALCTIGAFIFHLAPHQIVLGLMILLLVGFTLGFLDDRRDITPRFRLVGLAGTALLLVLWQSDLALRVIHSGVFGGVYDLWWLGVPLGAFAIAGMANAVNMADGSNGLVPGVALIWAGLMAPWALTYAPETLSILVGVAAAMAAIFLFNLAGRLFMGDSGAYALGVLFGALALYLYNRAQGALPAELVALWFGALIVDVGRLFLQRLCRRRNPMMADREHLHHLLERYLPGPAMLIIYWALVLLPGLAVTLDGRLLTPVVGLSFAAYFALVGAGYAVARRAGRLRPAAAE